MPVEKKANQLHDTTAAMLSMKVNRLLAGEKSVRYRL